MKKMKMPMKPTMQTSKGPKKINPMSAPSGGSRPNARPMQGSSFEAPAQALSMDPVAVRSHHESKKAAIAAAQKQKKASQQLGQY